MAMPGGARHGLHTSDRDLTGGITNLMAGRREARIFTSIWNDEAFLALSPREQRMYFFLLSQRDLSFCGVLSLRMRRWARSARDLTAAQVEEDLEGLAQPFRQGLAEGSSEESGRPLVVVDEDTEEVFVRSLIRHDGIWKIPNLLKSAREAATLVESPTILAELLYELHRIPVEESESKQVRAILGEFIADLEAALGKGSGNPPPKGSGNPSGDPKPNPSAEGSQGKGEGNGSSYRDPHTPGTPDPAAPPRLRAVRDPDPRLLGNQLLDEHMAACSPRPPRKVLQRTGEQIDDLLDEGIPAADIRAALSMLRARPQLGPGVLPNLVHEARTTPNNSGSHQAVRPGRSGANVHHEHAVGDGLMKGF